MRAQGMGPIGGSPQEFSKAIDTDVAKWRELITAAGLKQ